MAIVTNTLQTYGAVGVREDLEDTIWDLFADETWALKNLDKTKASGTYHEWQLDSLAAAAANNSVEGDDASFSAVGQPVRVGNYTSIARKTFVISGTVEEVAKAGRKREAARQMMKQMRELKNDMEYMIVRNQGSSAGGAATARAMAGMESWIATNETLATTTSSATTPGFSSGTVAAPTDGTTTGAFTEASLKSALSSAWTQGGQITTILTGTTQKNAIDAFPGIATRFVDTGRTEQASIVGAASVYVSGYGTHRVVLHRHVRSSVVLCVDPEYWAIAQLRAPFHTKLAQTGDAEKHMLLAEFTLVSRNEKASAKVVACA